MAGIKVRLRHSTPPLSVEDYRTLAHKKLAAMAWHYIDGAADDLVTLRDNRRAFDRWRLRQRGLTGVIKPDLKSTVAGVELSLPVALAPTGLNGLAHWTADIAAARGAEAAGTRHVLSTASCYTLEEVAEATDENHWFQLYPFGNRPRVGRLMDRAAAAGYTALFVTIDVQTLGNREGEKRTGLSMPPVFTATQVADVVKHPAWWWNAWKHKRMTLVHYAAENNPHRTLSGAVESVREQQRSMQADLNWEDLKWMRDRWKGPLYVKGIMDGDDAVRSVVEIGADGVVVSNHGGRQLDSAPGTLDVLPEVVEKLAGRGEVLIDGGFRRGTDVIKAVALGAKAAMIGRPYVYGTAVAGEKGVKAVLEIFRDEIARSLVLMGCARVSALDRSWIQSVNGGK